MGVPVEISLSRPERCWRKSLAADEVGCMMGLYLLADDAPEMLHRDQHTLAETVLLPAAISNSSSDGVTMRVVLPPGKYVIMPTTYEPGKQGPFFLTAYSPAPCSLRHWNRPMMH